MHQHDKYFKIVKIATNVLYALSLALVIIYYIVCLIEKIKFPFINFLIIVLGIAFSWLLMQLFFGLLLDIKIIRDNSQNIVKQLKKNTNINNQNRISNITDNTHNQATVVAKQTTATTSTTQSYNEQSAKSIFNSTVDEAISTVNERISKETIKEIDVSCLDEHMKKVYDLYKKGYITKEQFEQELKNNQ